MPRQDEARRTTTAVQSRANARNHGPGRDTRLPGRGVDSPAPARVRCRRARHHDG